MEPLEPRIVLSASGFGEEASGSASADGGGGGSIVNGTVIPQSAYPTVGIVNDGCTGTLISPRHVLTAAHCTSSGTGTFRLDGVNHTAIQQIDHFSEDIAIMVLAEEITDVTPSEILRERPIDRATGGGVGEELILVGYGNGGTTGNPANDFGTLREGFTELETVTDTELLWWMVGAEWNGQDESNTASGDSGGPAFVRRDYDGDGTFELYIAGTTRGSVAGFDPWNHDHADDMRVDVFADWIDDILEPPEDDHVDSPSADATPLVFDSTGLGTASGEIGITGDRDVFQFTLVQSTAATISLTADNMNELDTFLRLYNSSGSQIASNDDISWPSNSNSRITRTLSAGTYYASATSYIGLGDETGAYSLEVDVDPSAVFVPVPGDFDGDQDVDGDDFLVWQNSFGVDAGGDADDDGDTDGDDFLIWQGSLGASSGAAAMVVELELQRQREEGDKQDDRLTRPQRSATDDRIFAERENWRTLRIGRGLGR